MRREAGLMTERQPEPDFDFSQTSYIVANHARPVANPPPEIFAFYVIVCTGFERQSDLSLFGEHDRILLVNEGASMADLLTTHLHIFPSKSQARKSRKEFCGTIPAGWSEIKVGKRWVFIWKPTE